MATLTPEPSTYKYPHPAVAVDLAIFSIRDSALCVLLVERGVEPFRGRWALPGGFVRMDEDLQAGAERELQEETGVRHAYLEQVGAFGKPDRDPRERVISIAFYAIISSDQLELRAGSDATSARWWKCDDVPPLAFDHTGILSSARERLTDRVRRSSLALQFLPTEFALSDLQHVHELILGESIDKRNFRKWVMGLNYLEPTGSERRGGQHRPAALFRARPQASVLRLELPLESGQEGADSRASRAVETAYRTGFNEGLRALRQRVDAAEQDLRRSQK
jgi:8-oxo-dGTP diphosphatase